MMQSSEGGSRAGWSRGVWREATPPSGETNAPEIPRQCLGQATSHLMESGSDSKECACNAGDPVPALGQEDPLEKGIATHSSVLAWRIPWTEKPGGPQSKGSQRVRHN